MDRRDRWTHYHHCKRLILARHLSLERQLEWAERLHDRALRQQRLHLTLLATIWQGDIIEKSRENHHVT